MTARQATIERARLRGIAVAGFAIAAWVLGATAAQAAPPGEPAGIQGARDRVGVPDLITTHPVVVGADAVLTSVIAPAVAALPLHDVASRLARLSFPF